MCFFRGKRKPVLYILLKNKILAKTIDKPKVKKRRKKGIIDRHLQNLETGQKLYF